MVTIATYFFVTCLIGQQFLELAQGYAGCKVDLGVPIFTLLHVGGLKKGQGHGGWPGYTVRPWEHGGVATGA